MLMEAGGGHLRKDFLAVTDQAIVSGTSFLTTVLIGRVCGAEELGIYSLGFTLLVTWSSVQESLIALPYTICCHRQTPETQREFAGSVLVHQVMLSLLALVSLAATGAALSLWKHIPGLTTVIWALSAVLPFALLREFGRRYAFAHLRMHVAFVLDLFTAAIQLFGLFWLARTGALTAASAFAAIGVGCTLAAGCWLYGARRQFAIRRDQIWQTMRHNWALGKWLFAAQLTLSFQTYCSHWLLAWLVGTTATGLYFACLTIAQSCNPFTIGMSNALAPRTAQAFVLHGGQALRRVVYRSTFLVCLALTIFCLIVLFAGQLVVNLLYHGDQYDGQGHTVFVLSLSMMIGALGMPASNGLAAIKRPDVIFKIGLLVVGLSVILVPCLILAWGVEGAAYGFLAGNIVGSLGRWLAFEFLVPRRAPMPAAVPAALLLNGNGRHVEESTTASVSGVKSLTCITTSWDDGHPLDMRVAELLAKYGLRGTFYVPREAGGHPTLEPAQIRELSSEFEVGGHTIHHVDLTRVSDECAWQEIADSKTWLEEVTGVACPMFCPPKGRCTAKHRELIRRAEFLGMRSVELLSVDFPQPINGLMLMATTVQAYPHALIAYARNTLNRGSFGNLWRYMAQCRFADWQTVTRSLLKDALEHGGVFHLWGHSWELEKTGQWHELEEVLRLMSEFTNRAPALTNGQVCHLAGNSNGVSSSLARADILAHAPAEAV
jgi:O-antigen/teichoic acid export membrane protein/peptidoglycan/xylan/chitin deacetylase (PgdA/CDA1 family)